MALHRLLAGLLATTVCSTSASAQRIAYDSAAESWTLTSGPVSYRLVRRGQQVAFDYFGPTSRMGGAPDTAQQTRSDLTGVAADQSLEPTSLRLISDSTVLVAPGVTELRLRLVHASLPLQLDVRYAAWGETGVFSREIRLTNEGSSPLPVARLPSISWELPGGDYTLRYLWGSWGQERQLATETLAAGARRFEQTRGRSSNGYVPWLSLRNRTLGVEYLAELAWSGNWWMEAERRPGTGAAPLRDQAVLVSLGMHNDFGGALTLAPGDTITLPRAVFTATAGDLDDAANQMHRYQRSYLVPRVKTNQPPLVQFNTWFPLGPKVDITNTIQAADAAAVAGAEVYVLDSGWYGSGDWERTLGDYEPDPRKFPRGLEELADHVHQKGMKFGLWVEIENAGIESRLFHEHPEWCLPYEGKPWITANRCQLDFASAAVRQWATATVERLVSRYRLDWIKIDYNIDVGDRFDPARSGQTGRRLHDHLDGLLRLARQHPRRASRPGAGELLQRRTQTRPRRHGAHPYRLVIRRGGSDCVSRAGLRLHAAVRARDLQPLDGGRCGQRGGQSGQAAGMVGLHAAGSDEWTIRDLGTDPGVERRGTKTRGG